MLYGIAYCFKMPGSLECNEFLIDCDFGVSKRSLPKSISYGFFLHEVL